jgi:large subunit ribosomal protein L31e
MESWPIETRAIINDTQSNMSYSSAIVRPDVRSKTLSRRKALATSAAHSASLRRNRFETMGRDAKAPDVITREYTINLGKAITGITFKKRAPRAVAAVRVSTARMERAIRPLSPKRSDRGTRARVDGGCARRRGRAEDAGNDAEIYFVRIDARTGARRRVDDARRRENED